MPLIPPVVHQERYMALQVRHAVKHMLHDTNVQRVSWGTKKVSILDQDVDFPRLVRKKQIEIMTRDYLEHIPYLMDRIGSTSFQTIPNAITSTDMKARKAVDYVSGRLLYGNFDMLRKILKISNSNDLRSLLKTVDALKAFMKQIYERHVGA